MVLTMTRIEDPKEHANRTAERSRYLWREMMSPTYCIMFESTQVHCHPSPVWNTGD
jgi:hypothetical protein